MSDANTDGLLGRLAVHYKLVTLDQLNQATRDQARAGGGQPLGQLLVAKGIINAGQLEQLLKVQREYLAKQQAAAPRPAAAPTQASAGPVAGAAAQAVASMAAARRPTVSAAIGGHVEILTKAVADSASDIHLHAGAPIRYRVHGVLHDIEPEPLTRERAEGLVMQLLDEGQRAILNEKGQVDFAYTLDGVPIDQWITRFCTSFLACMARKR
jgi:type II secretory ATPase GspE/PulE/Tfp pilus assembly ATPase PilB-like protein